MFDSTWIETIYFEHTLPGKHWTTIGVGGATKKTAALHMFSTKNFTVSMLFVVSRRSHQVLLPGDRIFFVVGEGGVINILLSVKKYMLTWGFPKIGYPQIINSNRVFPYKPSILGYRYFWKHTYGEVG